MSSTIKQSNRPDTGIRTLEDYEGHWCIFLRWLKEKHPTVIYAAQITSNIAFDYFNDIWEDQISATTFNIKKQTLTMIFKYIQQAIGLEENPFIKIKRKTANIISREAFTSEQVALIFAGFETGFFYETEVEGLGPGRKRIRRKVKKELIPLYKDEMYVLLNLCCWSGCRGEDGCLMQWSSIDWKRSTITYTPMKTSKKSGMQVTLPIHPQLLEALKRAEAWRSENKQGEDYIIPHVADRYKYNHCGVQKDVMKIIRCATGLETTAEVKGQHRKMKANKYSLHSFRHTFVSFCANAGVPLTVVASIVGHTSTAMKQHYTHISDEAKTKAIAALPVLTEAPAEESQKEELMKQLSEMSAEELQQLLNQKNTTLEFAAPPATEELTQGDMDFGF